MQAYANIFTPPSGPGTVAPVASTLPLHVASAPKPHLCIKIATEGDLKESYDHENGEFVLAAKHQTFPFPCSAKKKQNYFEDQWSLHTTGQIGN